MGWGLSIKMKFQHSWWQMVISWWWALVKVEGHCCYSVAKLSRTLLQPHGLYSLPGSSEGISQGRILEWVAISFYKGSSWSQNWTQVPCIGRQIPYCWATKEAPITTYVIRLYFRWSWGWFLKKKNPKEFVFVFEIQEKLHWLVYQNLSSTFKRYSLCTDWA